MDQSMILKLILLGIVFVAVYRLMGGNFSLSSPKKEAQRELEDALEECQACGTYVTRKEAIVVQGKFYCSKECLE